MQSAKIDMVIDDIHLQTLSQLQVSFEFRLHKTCLLLHNFEGHF